MAMETIVDDDARYLKWVQNNPNGFVINEPKQRGLTPVLHKASCTHITTDQRTNYTTGAYKKHIFLDAKELDEYRGDPFKHCKVCDPNI